MLAFTVSGVVFSSRGLKNAHKTHVVGSGVDAGGELIGTYQVTHYLGSASDRALDLNHHCSVSAKKSKGSTQ